MAMWSSQRGMSGQPSCLRNNGTRSFSKRRKPVGDRRQISGIIIDAGNAGFPSMGTPFHGPERGLSALRLRGGGFSGNATSP